MTAAEKILQKALAASSIDSREWNAVQAGLRDRAFFSSTVASVRFLHAAREMAAAQAAGGMSESEIRRDLRRLLAGENYDPGDKANTIQDLRTRLRLDLIIKTNVQQARGYIHHLEATAPGAVAAFPAQELVRRRRREIPRNWHERWREAGGRLYPGGRMIALKDDPVWTAISRFGTPYPPFDFNSGMGVRDIPRSEAVSLGIITDRALRARVERAEADIAAGRRPGFNDNLQAEIPFANNADWQFLKNAFRDQIQKSGDTIKWREHIFADAFDGGNFSMHLGMAQPTLLDKLPRGISADDFAGKQLVIDQTWLDNKRADSSTHRAHFAGYGIDSDPIEKRDVALLPALWRSPDRAMQGNVPGKKRLVAELDAFDGSTFRAIFDYGGTQVRLITFFKPTKNPR